MAEPCSDAPAATPGGGRPWQARAMRLRIESAAGADLQHPVSQGRRGLKLLA